MTREVPVALTDNDEVDSMFYEMRSNLFANDESQIPQSVLESMTSCNYESTIYGEGKKPSAPLVFDYAETHLNMKNTTTKALRTAVKRSRARELRKSEIPKENIGLHSFIALSLLGVGSFGEVFLVKKKDTGQLYAMKILKKDRVIKNNLKRYALTERNVLAVTNHPFVCGIDFAFQTDDRLFLILEFCQGGDLSQYLKEEDFFSEEKAKQYLAEILLALEDLHSRDIIFRDLKPENVVLDKDGHAKLTDFGLSKEGVEHGTMAKSFCGSYAYLAPEMVQKKGHTFALDWYLFGVLMYEMLEGLPPFYDNKKEQLFDNILNQTLEISDDLSDEACDLMGRLLNKDPKLRLGYSGCEDIKNHPWFKGVYWELVAKKKQVMAKPYLMKPISEIMASRVKAHTSVKPFSKEQKTS